MGTTIGRVLSIASLACALTLIASAAQAQQQINSSGAICAATDNTHVGDIQTNTNGVFNMSTTASRYVTCAVPRTPLNVSSTNASFYLDGTDANSAQTTCILYSYNYTGTLLDSTSVTETAATFDQLMQIPAADAGTFAYISMLCLLPANQNGSVLGITSLP
jgi:hypothetical protein